MKRDHRLLASALAIVISFFSMIISMFWKENFLTSSLVFSAAGAPIDLSSEEKANLYYWISIASGCIAIALNLWAWWRSRR